MAAVRTVAVAAAVVVGLLCGLAAFQGSSPSPALLLQREAARDFITPGGRGLPGPVLNVKNTRAFAIGGAKQLAVGGRRAAAKQQALARTQTTVVAPGDPAGDPQQKWARQAPLGPRENVYVHVLPAHAGEVKPVAAEFSHGSQELFKELASVAGQDLPDGGFTRPTDGGGRQIIDQSGRGGVTFPRTSGGLPGAATYSGQPDLGKELLHSLDGIGFEQDRFHFSPEMGPGYNGR
ncbi:hypothetical protein T484DRAFT_1938118 [Baffinella frigidus]|nr:hypothetical protein T484DRAFT_1938118 [Cryptophyta sp. CCMP2293]